MTVKEESEKVGLKLSIQKTKIMASSPITSWKIVGKQWKQWQTLFWGGSKITADGDYSHEIKRCLLLERKVMTNLDSILKSREMTLPTKVHLVSSVQFSSVAQLCPTLCDPMNCSTPGLPVYHYGFSSSHIWMWELDYKESWVLKNWCFWTVVLEKALESLDCRRSKQSILKEISPEYSLEGLMLKLKL